MSEETNTETKVEQEKPTPEQIEAGRQKALNFYRLQTELLTAQAEYEKVMADIEQSRAKRMEMIIRQAQMQAGPETEAEEPEEKNPEEKKRTLKKS